MPNAAELAEYVEAGGEPASTETVTTDWKGVTFSSSNKKIATVSSKGIVTGKKKGKCSENVFVIFYKIFHIFL